MYYYYVRWTDSLQTRLSGTVVVTSERYEQHPSQWHRGVDSYWDRFHPLIHSGSKLMGIKGRTDRQVDGWTDRCLTVLKGPSGTQLCLQLW